MPDAPERWEVRHFVSDTSRVDVVGTQSYQDLIWRLVGEPTAGPGGRAEWHGEATLEPEPSNAYDRNAVRVAINGETVGYLDRILAERLQPALILLEQHHIRATVPCYARGGFVFRDGTRASAGLGLRFDPVDILTVARSLPTTRPSGDTRAA